MQRAAGGSAPALHTLRAFLVRYTCISKAPPSNCAAFIAMMRYKCVSTVSARK